MFSSLLQVLATSSRSPGQCAHDSSCVAVAQDLSNGPTALGSFQPGLLGRKGCFKRLGGSQGLPKAFLDSSIRPDQKETSDGELRRRKNTRVDVGLPSS